MAETVPVVVAMTRLRNRRAAAGVDLPATATGTHLLDRRLLDRPHELVDLERLLLDALPGGERTRAVRAVAVELRAPVDRHEHVGRDRLSPWLRVGQRAVRAGRHDRLERDRLGAEQADLVLEVDGHVVLGPAGEPALEHR